MGSLPGPTPLRALWRAADPLLPPTLIALTAVALGPAQTMVGEQAILCTALMEIVIHPAISCFTRNAHSP